MGKSVVERPQRIINLPREVIQRALCLGLGKLSSLSMPWAVSYRRRAALILLHLACHGITITLLFLSLRVASYPSTATVKLYLYEFYPREGTRRRLTFVLGNLLPAAAMEKNLMLYLKNARILIFDSKCKVYLYTNFFPGTG
ncbi:uncharacterized protein [Prorops nasuta]|uniref:uncharacterized protein isoform X2 n=1 Tax=Prorops nasuta TaxID=863751 RepID=UPI0034CF0F82